MCPSFRNFGPQDIPVERRLLSVGSSHLAQPSYFRYENRFDLHFKINSPHIPLAEDYNQGHASPRIQTIVASLSETMTKIAGVFCFKNEQELREFIKFSFQNGYYFPLNYKWKLPSYFLTHRYFPLQNKQINQKIYSQQSIRNSSRSLL